MRGQKINTLTYTKAIMWKIKETGDKAEIVTV